MTDSLSVTSAFCFFTAEREEIEQKDKRPTPSMYFSNRGSVLTRRIPGIEQVYNIKLTFNLFSFIDCFFCC